MKFLPLFLVCLLLPFLARADGKTEYVTGAFAGIEEGDYMYFKLRTSAGIEAFMISRDSKSAEEVMANPARYAGRKCRAKIEIAKEYIPEAGEQMEVKTLIGIEWLR